MDTCYHCFREKQNSGPCPYCGYDGEENAKKYPLALKPGSILNGRYIVGRVLGQGGFGITYIAFDDQRKDRVAIKEYYPAEFVGRTQGTCQVQVHSEDQQENFEYGKEQFLAEAKTLAAFIGDSHIVRIHSYFEENGTAYFSMEYVDGLPLDKYMAQNGGRLSVEEASRLLLPLMDSMDQIHAKGIVHRDIAPDNIIIQKDGTAKLIDFGAARYSTGEKSKSLDVVLKHGFAPYEQYMRRGRQGPFTDVYAMAATYYYAITGKIPPEAVERRDEDELIPPSTLRVKIDDITEEALLKALEVKASERYQTMGSFHNALLEAELLQRRKVEEIRETERRQRENGENLYEETEKQVKAEQERREAEERARAEEARLRREAEEPARVEAEQQKQAAAPQQTPPPAPKKKSGGSKVVPIVLGLAVAAAVGFFALKPKATPAVPKVSSTPTTAVTATPTPTPRATSTPTSKPSATPTPTPKVTAIPTPTVTPNPSSSPTLESYQKAAEAGDPSAMNELGEMYESGRGVDQDYKKAEEWYQKSAEAGYELGMYNLAKYYANGKGGKVDNSKAAEWYQKAAELGNSNAMLFLGNLYYNGWGVKQSYTTALDWYQKAADAGIAEAMNTIGSMYYKGYGVKQNYAKAVEWFEKAAERSHSTAACNLGVCYSIGNGVMQDDLKAAEWFEMAANLGNANAQESIGNYYYNGWGVKQDYEKAAEWFSKAANAGIASAMRQLGECYSRGRGVKRDYQKALEWYGKAVDAGDSYAKTLIQKELVDNGLVKRADAAAWLD